MIIHGMSRTPTYVSWQGMIQRCINKKNKDFKKWGAKGILVHKNWLNFSTFLKDMGIRPSLKHSLDRIDNNGNYEPKNCRWATKSEQQNNRKNNYLIEFNGNIKTLTEWADFLKIDRRTLRARLRTYGWTIKKSFTHPVRSR